MIPIEKIRDVLWKLHGILQQTVFYDSHPELLQEIDALLLEEEGRKGEGHDGGDPASPSVLSGVPSPETGGPPDGALQAPIAPAHGPSLPRSECVTISANVFAFLHGAADIDGLQFGDRNPDRKGKFWWRHFLVPVTPTDDPVNEGGGDPSNWAYEDELPEMTKEEYHAWYLSSEVIHGVRMGPRFPPATNPEQP